MSAGCSSPVSDELDFMSDLYASYARYVADGKTHLEKGDAVKAATCFEKALGLHCDHAVDYTIGLKALKLDDYIVCAKNLSATTKAAHLVACLQTALLFGDRTIPKDVLAATERRVVILRSFPEHKDALYETLRVAFTHGKGVIHKDKRLAEAYF